MIAVELVDTGDGRAGRALASASRRRLHRRGVIVLTCGTYGNVIGFLPPLSIPDDLLLEGPRRRRGGVRHGVLTRT